MRLLCRLGVLFFIFLLFHQSPLLADPVYYSGYTGSLPSDPRDLARTYFKNPQIQQLIREMAARGPATRERVLQAISGTPFSLDDLQRVKILREDAGKYYVGFNFFTAEDMRAVASAAEKYVPSLVQAYHAKQAEFDRIFSHYPVQSVERKKLAFVMIAGFSLNWDGLRIAEQAGFRRPVLVHGDGWKYSFWASEELPGHDTHGFYWGSSTFPGSMHLPGVAVDYSFSSYGDPYSDPRMNFPDLFTSSLEELQPAVRKAVEAVGPVHETALGLDLKDVLGLESLRDIGAILFALRQGPRDQAELAGLHTSRNAGALLSLLQETQYIEKDSDGKYHLLVPVLDEQDKTMVDESLKLSAEIIGQWLAENYPNVRKDLGILSSAKQGVPFESLFTQIWHEFFGLATRDLVKSGFLFDPSGPAMRYKGSFPVLWRQSLYNLRLE